MTETVQGRVPQEEIEEALKEVIDPELGVNIVDLGLLYGLRWDEDGTLILDLTLTTAACPLQEVIEEQVQANLDNLVDSWRVNWVWMPPWGPERITEDGRDMMRARVDKTTVQWLTTGFLLVMGAVTPVTAGGGVFLRLLGSCSPGGSNLPGEWSRN